MQEKAIIRAEFDPGTGNVLSSASGSNLDLLFLIGQIARDMADSWARVKGIPEDLAMMKVLTAITMAMAARHEPDEGSKLDLSHEYNGG